MGFFRKVEDNIVVTLDHGRLVLAAIGGFLFIALVFLMGVQVGKALSGYSMEAAMRAAAAREPVRASTIEEPRAVGNPQLSFYEEVKKPADAVDAPAEMKAYVAQEKSVPTQVTPTSPYVPPPPPPPAPVEAPTLVPAKAPEVSALPVKVPPPPPRVEVRSKPTPPPQSQAVRSGAFAVQIESYQEKGKAEAAQKKLSSKGIITEVAPSQVGGVMWYRLIVGGFSTREAADRYKKDTLKNKGLNGYVITR